MKKSFIILLSLALLLQYKLWGGQGNFFEVRELYQKLEEKRLANQALRLRNLQLFAEVESLKKGTEAIEELAREELGMIGRGETFYQIISKPK
ncbi:MAG: cell division protein FtsB [Gammaproteobacteria bacterium]|nr:cell division protein FtsB [Gammaproteobacteria bacterium]